jgi:hypothetical protein
MISKLNDFALRAKEAPLTKMSNSPSLFPYSIEEYNNILEKKSSLRI